MPRGFSLSSPSLAVHRDTVYVASNLFPRSGSIPTARGKAIVLRIPGRPLPLPPGDFVFAYPKGLVGRSGAYELFWAEPGDTSRAAEPWPLQRLTSLWHSAHDARGWSTPERILAGARIDGASEDNVVDEGADGVLHLFVPFTDSTGMPRLLYLRREASKWARTVFPMTAAYAAVAAWGGSSVAVTFTAPDLTVRRDANSMFLMRSRDGGATWATPVLLSRSGTRAATRPGLVVSPEGTLHLVWAQNLSGGETPEVLRHWRSADGGATWTPLQDAPLPQDAVFRLFRLAADPCGGVEAITEVIYADRAAVWEIRWDAGVPSLERLRPGTDLTIGTGLVSGGGSMHSVWSEARRLGDRATPLISHSRRCTRPDAAN